MAWKWVCLRCLWLECSGNQALRPGTAARPRCPAPGRSPWQDGPQYGQTVTPRSRPGMGVDVPARTEPEPHRRARARGVGHRRLPPGRRPPPGWERSSPGQAPRGGSPLAAHRTKANGRWAPGSESAGTKPPTARFTRSTGTASTKVPGWDTNARAAADAARWHDRLAELVRFRAEGNDWPRHRDYTSEIGPHPRDVDPLTAAKSPQRRPRSGQGPAPR
jgi:hypothetical protein